MKTNLTISPFLIRVVVLAVLCVGLSWGATKSYAWYSLQREGLKKEKNALVELDEKMGAFQSIFTEEQEEMLELLHQALPSEKDFYGLVGVVGQVARDNGFTVNSFKLSPGLLEDEKGSVNTGMVSAEVELRGPESRYSDLLYDFEAVLPVLTIGKMDSSFSQSSVGVEVRLSSYHLPPPGEIKKAAELPIKLIQLDQKSWDLLRGLEKYKSYGLQSIDGLENSRERVRENPFVLGG